MSAASSAITSCATPSKPMAAARSGPIRWCAAAASRTSSRLSRRPTTGTRCGSVSKHRCSSTGAGSSVSTPPGCPMRGSTAPTRTTCGSVPIPAIFTGPISRGRQGLGLPDRSHHHLQRQRLVPRRRRRPLLARGVQGPHRFRGPHRRLQCAAAARALEGRALRRLHPGELEVRSVPDDHHELGAASVDSRLGWYN